mgnify:CR=1 FL=1|tara:strand:+ start:132 stop:872 length:741 start_codon:yes stop_codon:yes gene_type:complete
MNSHDLKNKLIELKKKTLETNNNWVFEKNRFDLFLDDVTSIIIKITKILIFNKMLKKLTYGISDSIMKIIDILFSQNKVNNTKNNSLVNSTVGKLEKKLDNHEKLFQSSLVENRSLKREISNLHQKIEKYLNETNTSKNSSKIGHNSASQVDFYQEENLRLGSELVETKKKFEILKNEIEKYEQQRSNLISKINSVNDALGDTNILTNVFKNDIKPKINIIDHAKIKNKLNDDINEQIRNIFMKQN